MTKITKEEQANAGSYTFSQGKTIITNDTSSLLIQR